MNQLTMADLEEVYDFMRGLDIPPLPTGKHLATLDSEDEIPDGSLIAGPYLPDQGDYRHVGDIAKYHIFVPTPPPETPTPPKTRYERPS